MVIALDLADAAIELRLQACLDVFDSRAGVTICF